MSVRIGVTGGSGGVGASTFAAVLAWTARAARAAPAALSGPAAGPCLVDLDEVGGGLDVLLGIERVPGARWSQLRLGGGRLDPRLLIEGLPRWSGVPVLAADRPPPAAAGRDPVSGGLPGADGVAEVLEAAACAVPVVLDLPRAPSPCRSAALAGCDLVVLIARARVRELTAACAVLAGLESEAGADAGADAGAEAGAEGGVEGGVEGGARIGVLLRPGDVPGGDAAALLGRPVLARLPTLARPVRLARPDRSARRPPHALVRVAAGVLDGVMSGGPDGARDGGPGGPAPDEEELSWPIPT